VDLDGDPGPNDKIDPERFKRILADRKAKNKELLELKAKADEQSAKLVELEDAAEQRRLAELSEIEKAKEEVVKAKAELESTKAEVARQSRLLTCTQAGVAKEYLDFMEVALLAAKNSDKNFDPAKWIEDQKQARPAMFGEPAVVATTGGFARPDTDPRAQEIKAEVARLEALTYPSPEDRRRLAILKVTSK